MSSIALQPGFSAFVAFRSLKLGLQLGEGGDAASGGRGNNDSIVDVAVERSPADIAPEQTQTALDRTGGRAASIITVEAVRPIPRAPASYKPTSRGRGSAALALSHEPRGRMIDIFA